MTSFPIAQGHTPLAGTAFLEGGGEIGRCVRSHPWSATPLGPAEAWPQSLRTAACLVLHAKQAMFIAWGPDLTLLYNDEYAAVLGAKHPHALGQPFSDAWSDIWPQFGPIVRRVMAGEALSFEDLPIPMRRNGYDEDTWFSFSYTPMRDEAGQIAGLFCACNETTTKVRGEQALRAQEAMLEARVIERTAELDRVWRNSRDLLLVADANGIFRALNPAWKTVLGYDPEEMVGRSFLDFVWPEDVALTQNVHDKTAIKADLSGFENRYRHKDGSPRWISWNTSGEGEFIYAYGRHITAEKEHAETLRRIEDQLRQAQKMEAVGQLTGGLAHDFNNLLTGVSGSLELLQTRIAQGRINDVDRYVNAAQGAAKRAAALTHRLLAFSRRQTLDSKPTAVNRLVRGMEELIRRTIGPEIVLETVEAGGLWITLVDPGQLENALLNLCINARDAMPGGGKITIETANKWLDAAAARERDLPPGQYITLCVSDTGTGMATDVIDKAFEPFFTTKPIGMGTGLGLSMIYGFVRQSNGQVRIYSEVGHGSNICLYLPRHYGAEEVGDLSPQMTQAPRAEQGETVLVVDDEPTVRMLVNEVLEDLGYTAIEAADGTAGLKVLKSDVRLDLLVSDVGLPGMNGRRLADAAREIRPDLKVLFITGYAENAVLSHGHLEYGMHVLTKPFTMDALASRIKELINGK